MNPGAPIRTVILAIREAFGGAGRKRLGGHK
jgi:hypothetical protein